MATFYFDYYESNDLCVDEDGVSVPDLQSAVRLAEVAACQWLIENKDSRNISIAVRSTDAVLSMISVQIKVENETAKGLIRDIRKNSAGNV